MLKWVMWKKNNNIPSKKSQERFTRVFKVAVLSCSFVDAGERRCRNPDSSIMDHTFYYYPASEQKKSVGSRFKALEAPSSGAFRTILFTFNPQTGQSKGNVSRSMASLSSEDHWAIVAMADSTYSTIPNMVREAGQNDVM